MGCCFNSFVYHDLRSANAAPSTMVAALTLMLLSTPPLTSMLPTPPLATPKLMVPDILPGISCFISFVYHDLRSTMVAALSLMLLSTPPLTSIMATPMLMLPSCMELMAMRALLLWWLPLHLKC